jgi:hypothetical protein
VYPYKTWQEHERRVLGSSDTWIFHDLSE